MQTHNHRHCKGRRHFFKKVAIIGSTAIFGSAGNRRVKAGAPGTEKIPHTRGRYRPTAHIRRYYQRASF